LKLSSKSFSPGDRIPSEFAFAAIDMETHASVSSNRNPHLAWDDVPQGTKSFVLICHDPDVPSRPDDVNKEGREVPASLPRTDFFHWILLDIPPTVREIGAGTHSDRVTPRGKSGPSAGGGLRHGINDYTSWFAGDPEMRGQYNGYDGPAPPWNDSIVHHYVFTLYALDVPHLEVRGDLRGPHVMNALAGHVLARATLTGTYSLNPRLASMQ
jgi:Raf kinase inhibitor-like YbhB/YbcL family protein